MKASLIKLQLISITVLVVVFFLFPETNDESIVHWDAVSSATKTYQSAPMLELKKLDPLVAFKENADLLKSPLLVHRDFYTQEYINKSLSKDDMNKISRVYGLPDDLLFYQNHIESGGMCPEKPNSKGAVGCFQFLPDTAKEFGLINKQGDFTTSIYASADAAARYMTWLGVLLYGDQADFSDWDQVRHILASYNAGYMRVKNKNSLKIPPFYETVRYVSLIEDLVKERAVIVRKGDTLRDISYRTNVAVRALLRGNPNVTGDFDLKAGDVLSLPDSNGMTRMVVRSGMSLYEIKKRTGVSISEMVAANQLNNEGVIRTASILKIPTNDVYGATYSE